MGACSGKAREPEPAPPPAAALARKRGSVSAQGGMDPRNMSVNLATLPKVPKSEEAIEHIKAAIANNVLMKSLSDQYKEAVIASMKQGAKLAHPYPTRFDRVPEFRLSGAARWQWMLNPAST